MAKVILCEKPSVAKQIAEGLTALTHSKVIKQNGYYACGDYQITFAFGHLVEIDISAAFGSFSNFPVFPTNRAYVPSGDRTAKMQLKIISSLIKTASEVIIATDPGREGELIARLIIQHATKKNLPLKRLWTSESITPSVVAREMKNLHDGAEYESLYYEALARQHADCDVGINLSRALVTLVGDGQKWSIGRVQTPIVMILAKREDEIKNFVPAPYSLLKGVFGKGAETYTARYVNPADKATGKSSTDDEFGKLSETDVAALVAKLRAFKTATISSVKRRTKVEKPPLLHTITTLQIEANKKFSLGAMDSSKVLQDLYEKGFVSYPRTESKHLGTGNKSLVEDSLRSIGRKDLVPKVNTSNKRVFDNTKLTDHHALIPLKNGTKLSGKNKQVFEIVESAFIAAFYPDATSEVFSIQTTVSDENFVYEGTQDLTQGWKEVFNYRIKKFSFDLESGTVVDVIDLITEAKMTKPPARYNEATLLRIMENAHLLLPKEEAKLRLTMKNKENAGLGTGATRAGIINNVRLKGFFSFKGKQIIASEKSLMLFKKIYGKLTVADPIMTAEWEASLSKVRDTTQSYDGFMKNINQLVIAETKILKELKLTEIGSSVAIKCPKCDEQLRVFAAGASCAACSASFWKKLLGAKMTDKQFEKYINGEKIYMKGLKSKRTNKKFDSWIYLQDGDLKFDINSSAPVTKTRAKKTKSTPKSRSKTTAAKSSLRNQF